MIKQINCFYPSLSFLRPRITPLINAQSLCISSQATTFPTYRLHRQNQRGITNFRNTVYSPLFNFGSTPKQSPFRPKSTWPLQHFNSFTDYLSFIENKPDLEGFLNNEENAQRILNSFWQLLENAGKDAGKTLDKNAIKAFRLLYHQKILPMTEFTRLEKTFLLPGKLSDLTVHDYFELLIPFVNQNIGTREFYNTLSDSVIEKAKKETNNKNFLKVLHMFTKANAYSDSFRDWTIEYLKDLISSYKGDDITAGQLASMSLFMALEYEKTKFLHEGFYEMITKLLKERKDDFYQTIKGLEHLRPIWNFFQSTQIYDKELFKKLSREGQVLKKMPFIRKGTTPSEGHQEIFEELLKIVEKDKEVAVEKRIGVYFVDIFVGPDLVIEVNSFRHYFDFGTRRSGINEIRHRNLNALGYKIKELDLKDWYDVPREKKAEFLKNLIKNTE